MGLFKALVRTAVNLALLPAKLPITLLHDSATVLVDATEGDESIYNRTKRVIDQLKEEASTDD